MNEVYIAKQAANTDPRYAQNYIPTPPPSPMQKPKSGMDMLFDKALSNNNSLSGCIATLSETLNRILGSQLEDKPPQASISLPPGQLGELAGQLIRTTDLCEELARQVSRLQGGL